MASDGMDFAPPDYVTFFSSMGATAAMVFSGKYKLDDFSGF